MGTNIDNGFIEYRYLHCKHLDPQSPALTFKFKVNQVDSTVQVAWAVCSMNDNFARAAGRKITDERLDNGRSIVVPYDRSKSLVDNAIVGMQALMVQIETSEMVVSGGEELMINEIRRAIDAYIEVKTCLEFHEMFDENNSMCDMA